MGNTILVGSTKGGVGKSMIATNLAAYHQSQLENKDILLIDTDIQGSTADWCYFRTGTGKEDIECIQLFGKKIITEIQSKKERYNDIIIDAGGTDSTELRSAMVIADKMITPIRASQFDVSTLETLDSLLEEVKATVNPDLQCFAVVNGLKNHPNIPEFGQAMEAVREFDNIEPIDFPIHDRIIYSRTGREGLGVHEMDNPNPKATTEIQKIHSILYEQETIQEKYEKSEEGRSG